MSILKKIIARLPEENYLRHLLEVKLEHPKRMGFVFVFYCPSDEPSCYDKLKEDAKQFCEAATVALTTLDSIRSIDHYKADSNRSGRTLLIDLNADVFALEDRTFTALVYGLAATPRTFENNVIIFTSKIHPKIFQNADYILTLKDSKPEPYQF